MIYPNKKTILYAIIAFLLIAVSIATIVLFYNLLNYDKKSHRDGDLYHVAIEGEYSEEGGEWKKFTPETNFENWDLRDITLRGHFTRDIPEGEKLFLNIDHMRVSLKLNGEEVFNLTPVKGDGNPTRATGKQWAAFISPGITTQDSVELNFGNLYWNAYMIQFDELLRHMYTGDERMMLFQALEDNFWTITIGTIFFFLTLFLLIISICCRLLKINGALNFLWLGMITLFSSLWFFTLSPAPTLIFPWPVFLNVLYAFSMQGMAMFITLFATNNVTEWRRTILLYCQVVFLILLLVGLINQMFSIQDLYSAINYYSIFDIIIALCIVFCLGYEAFSMKKKESENLLKAMLPLAGFAIVELINGYIQFCEASVMLGLGLIIFVVAEGIYTLQRIKRSMESEKRALILENELNESRSAIMLSQIQPHFLYNSLVVIVDMCDQDPQEAKKTVIEFAHYLRGNLDSLTLRNTIPFDKELKHVKYYLALEQKRFGDEIHVEYKIQVKDFMIPALTIQPLVENAVRYGLSKKENGGTITISTYEVDNNYIIEISDNGVGFETDKPKEDSRSHIGIDNVRHRLKSMCNGELSIESIIGIGTKVLIKIPKL